MKTTNDSNSHILTVNVGSSSIKFAIFDIGNGLEKKSHAAVENIGQLSARLIEGDRTVSVIAKDHAAANDMLLKWFTTQTANNTVTAVAHRVVHGGPNYHKSQEVTKDLLVELRKFTSFDAEHLPAELQMIESFQQRLPDAKQIVCFDTAFHHDLPTRARLLPIPRRFAAAGVRRYGFHGLSYAYVLEELRRVEGAVAANGKVVIAHLGSGASLAAIRDSKSIDTTMSLTPASGLPMSTRSGDLDPGIALYCMRTQGYDVDQFNHMVNFESGMLGLSETSADMKKLLAIETADGRAKDAVDMFCYQVQKNIGSLAAALGGLNTLVFTGGIGENAPKIRERICADLKFLGITIEPKRNQEGSRLISTDDSQVGVHIIHTDESMTIAREAAKLMRMNLA